MQWQDNSTGRLKHGKCADTHEPEKKRKNGRPQKTIKQTESKTQHGAWC